MADKFGGKQRVGMSPLAHINFARLKKLFWIEPALFLC